MLQAIRDRATGWIAWVIIVLICIPFALWGINSYFEGEGGLAVAQVNETEIGYYQYRSALQQQRQQLQQMFGGAISDGLVSEALMREQALDRLVGDEVLVQQAVNNGLRVGDGQLATAISELPVFQEEGRFSQAAYDQFLRSRGTSPAGFEL
ncbi:MAG: SurA N-terminal domain-containing protein, partial [Gammaproteobacteria bacterium]|nr:SurA N-terminal domain-containing protein [Gammaproteobacteria bacterium]